MEEIWKPIKGYENYEISNLGNCKRKECKDNLGHLRKEKILKKNKDIYGYNYYALCKNGKRKNFSVHRLVAKNFDDNYNEYLQVNHIDGDKDNNSIYNLEMVSDQENKKHAWEIGLYKYRSKKYNNIFQYSLDGKLIKKWKNISEIRKNTNYNTKRIYNCLNGKQKKTNNYIWRIYETNN